jgi:NTE family protein
LRTAFTIPILFLAALLQVQAQHAPQRQKVAVVMSGGGSSGLAHIGVLKALEENHIPIDYVAGTSMGAVVAGMYAAGMTPTEMEQLVLSKEFYEMAKGIINEDYKYYFKTDDPNPSWITARFEIDSGIKASIPVNIVSPYSMDINLIGFLAPAIAAAGYNFDSLYVPFRCVAADVHAKEAVIFRDGDMCQAIRASFTYPLYMKPIEVNGRLLFDGGIYNNFPSDVVLQDFYPDIIIGSVVASDLKPPKQNDLGSQLKSLIMSKTDYGAVCDNGIIIEPKIPDVPVMDFTRIAPLLAGGYNTTLQRMPEIRTVVSSTVSDEERNAKRQAFNQRKPELNFGNINITGLKKEQAEYVQLSIRQRPEAVSFEKVKREFFKLAADEMIKSIYPIATYNPANGNFDLQLDMERDNDIIAEFGGNISSSSINQAYVGLGYKFFRQVALGIYINGHLGKFYSSAQARGRLDLPTKLPVFLELGVTINQWNYFNGFTAFFEAEKPSYLIQNDRDVEVNVGLPLTTKIKAIPGISFVNLTNEYYHTNSFTSSDRKDVSTMNLFTAKLLLERRTLNKKMYANEGREYVLQARVNTGRDINQPGSTALNRETSERQRTWVSVRSRFDSYYFPDSKLRLGVFGELYWSSQHFFSNYQMSLNMAAQFEPTPESRTLFLKEYRGNRYGAIGLKGIWMAWKNLDVRVEAYMMHHLQKYRRNEDQSASYYPIRLEPHIIAMTAVVYHTPVGPVSISGNYYQKEERPWSVLFHIGYILFNRRALE